MRIFVEFSGTIAIPAVAGAFLGKWLDERYVSHPRYLIICLMIALLLSANIVVDKSKKYGKEYERLNRSNNT